jgi:hypothetical protein
VVWSLESYTCTLKLLHVAHTNPSLEDMYLDREGFCIVDETRITLWRSMECESSDVKGKGALCSRVDGPSLCNRFGMQPEHVRQSTPDSSLDLNHFQAKHLRPFELVLSRSAAVHAATPNSCCGRP